MSLYLGNCCDIGNDEKHLLKSYFSDATIMAQSVNPDGNNFIKVSRVAFMQYFSRAVFAKALHGHVEFYRSSRDGTNQSMTAQECGLWWIYNRTQDVHYFFAK